MGTVVGNGLALGNAAGVGSGCDCGVLLAMGAKAFCGAGEANGNVAAGDVGAFVMGGGADAKAGNAGVCGNAAPAGNAAG